MTTNVLNLPGDYKIRATSGTGTVFIDAGTLDVYNNTILGHTTGSNTISVNSKFIGDLLPNTTAIYNLGLTGQTWQTLNVEQVTQWGQGSDNLNVFNNTENVGNPSARPYNPADMYGSTVERVQAAVYVAGGVGIEKDLNVGGFIYGRIEISNTTLSVIITSTNINYEFTPVFSDGPGGSTLKVDQSGVVNGLTYNPYLGRVSTDRVLIAETDNAISTSTGVLQVAGGASIGKDVYVGDLVTATGLQPKADNSGHIGTTGTQWAEAYVHNLYTRIVGSTTGPIQIKPESRMTDVYGDIRVRGTNPIGTAPVVTNVLYVTMDGDDTNDGRALDASRACRTVGGAMNSPYYQPGTQILVSAGHYLEDNPLEMKPYTSVRGSDIRTTFLEPINKTQDLFHMNSGCYLNYMNFLNGRSGLLEGTYALGYNRGAYCTAFPPQTGDNRIDVFQSPYVQNCTNQSGPWLKDGTMFVPDQTVQIPLAVGMGSWEANTTSIVVSVSNGSISIGQSINPGQHNPGFFNARTLLLANKPFLQSQVVAFLDRTFNSNAFTYNTSTCSRDTELVIDAIATDLLYDSNSDSTFAGIQYWNHGAYTGNIPAEITATIAAIGQLKSIALSYVSSSTTATLAALFNTVTNILSSGTANVTNLIHYGGLPLTDPTLLSDVANLQAHKLAIESTITNWIDATYTSTNYTTATCSRDAGLIVDAIGMDLLHSSNSDSTFSGLQYWNQNTGYTGNIPSESTATIAAIAHLGTLVQGYISSGNQSTVSSLFSTINSILVSGTANVTNQLQFGGLPTTTSTTLSDVANLQAHKTLLESTVTNWIAVNYPTLSYTTATCQRDVGYIIDSICFDLTNGGNVQSIKSGVYYYSYNAASITIPTRETAATVSAFNHIKDIIPYIVTGTPLPTKYSTATQVTTGLLGTPAESIILQNKIDVITGIISNGPSVAEPKTPQNISTSYNASVKNAWQMLQNNKSLIQAEIIGYIENVLYGYNKETCRRDVGYIIDSVCFDLLHGGNVQSIKSGVYYYSYNTNSVLPVTTSTNEISATTAAYNFIKSIIPSIVTGQKILSTYQTGTVQVTNITPGSSHEVIKLKDKIDVITDIIRNGPTAAEDKTPIALIENTATNIISSYKILIANIPFIKAEVLAFINATMNTFTYNRQKSYRDAGILIENMAYDMAFGGDEKSIESGLAYWNGVVSVIPNSITQCLSAIDYLNQLSQQVVVNSTCTILIPPAEIPVSNQVKNLNLTGGAIAVPSIKQLFDITTNIISNGSSVAPDSYYNSTGPDAAFVSAEILMQANRTFIQENVINYINNSLCYPLKALPYNQLKCRRDAGVVVDSIASDLLFPTAWHSQSTFAGLQYYNQNSYVGAIKEQLNPTIDALTYLRDLSVKVVQNITTATDALVGVTRYTDGVQTTASNYATSAEVSTIRSEFANILSILNGNTTGWTDLIVPNGAAIELPSVYNTVDLLLANTTYLANEVVAYVNANNFVYDPVKCSRDTGLIVDALAQDLLFGGTSQTDFSGIQYWNHTSYVGAIASELTTTTNAINWLKSVAQKVIVGDTGGTRYANTSGQITAMPLSTASVAVTIGTDFDVITDILTNGVANVTTNIVPNGLIERTTLNGFDVNIEHAYDLLQANKTYLTDEVVAYVNANNPGFTYTTSTCARDVDFIVDSVSFDLFYGGNRQAVQSGVYYWNYNSSSSAISREIPQSIAAYNYLRSLLSNIVTGTAITSLYQTTVTQVTAGSYGTGSEVVTLQSLVDNINDIIENGPGHVVSKTPIGLTRSVNANIINASSMLEANRDFLRAEVIAFVDYTYGGYQYNQTTCARDVAYIIQSIAFDLLYGGNRQSIQTGLSYYISTTNGTVIPYESTATVDAFTFLGNLASTLVQGNSYAPRQPTVLPVLTLSPGSSADAAALVTGISTITNIIANGTSVIGPLKPITLTISTSTTAQNAYDILKANRSFIVAETIAYLDQTYNPNSFNYNQELCYRDTGLIIDAVSQDILLGGNQKSIESGLSYWNQGYSYVAGQETTTTLAISYARDLALKVIANIPVTPQPGTIATQVINTFFQYGGDYMPQQAVSRNFDIITNIIVNGPTSVPPVYAGSGLFSLTGLNGSSVKAAPKVTAVDELSTGTYLIGLDTSTVGFGTNATLYFGDVHVFPLQNAQVESLSLSLTGNVSTWNQRKVDPIGSMGGSLVDGAVVSDNSPIQSFVYDAFTQLPQGGRGIHVTNNGYAQLVSVFTIFCSVGVQCDNGGIASITNSNCNFGDISLLAKGYGFRSFSGTVFNPSFRSYPFSPDGTDTNGDPLPYLDQFYPTGYWPTTGNVEVFVPDSANRPHIGLVMEVVAPDGHENEQGFPGFLNSQPSTGTLTMGTITLTDISTTDVFVGNTVYIRDQFGLEYDDFPYLHNPDGDMIDPSGNSTSTVYPNPNYKVRYAATGTVVTDVNYNSISLNQALTNGGGDPTNATYFTLYFCGNSYYTVQTSSIASSPYLPNTNVLNANTNTNYQGSTSSQVSAHVAAIQRLNVVVDQVIANIAVTPSTNNTATQTILGLVTDGASAVPFIDLRFGYLADIVNAPTIAAAESVIPSNAIVSSGTIPQGAGSAVTLITNNIDFITEEVYRYSLANNPGVLSTASYQYSKCQRDVGLILQQLIYDLETGGNYNMVYSGLSYWSRPGTYHIIELGEAVSRPDLFPDGTIVNFYQRSYISASGYLFEYVGAGTNYGALPQRGVADPVQSKETVQLNSGKVFFTSTDQNGDFRIGPGLVISQATGVLSGRTFVQSLYANMTPFILAIE